MLNWNGGSLVSTMKHYQSKCTPEANQGPCRSGPHSHSTLGTAQHGQQGGSLALAIALAISEGETLVLLLATPPILFMGLEVKHALHWSGCCWAVCYARAVWKAPVVGAWEGNTARGGAAALMAHLVEEWGLLPNSPDTHPSQTSGVRQFSFLFWLPDFQPEALSPQGPTC